MLIIVAVCVLVPGVPALLTWIHMHGDHIAGNVEGNAEHGKALAVASDCAACHTAPGGAPFAGGLPLKTPFGAIISSNITPDRATGIGQVSLADLARSLRQGVGVKGQLLYPAMPYNHYTAFSDQDVADLRAYLATLAPAHNQVNANTLPFPFNIRQLMLGWDMLFFKDERFQPHPGKPADWNRGALLVNGAGHCASCHTGKNMLGGDYANTLGGGVVDGWYAPAITNSRSRGLASWSNSELAAYLGTGSNDHAIAAGPMDEVVRKSTALMPASDLAAIATYLKSLPGRETPRPAAISMMEEPMPKGREVFSGNCAGCHRIEGGGASGLTPPLASDNGILSDDPATVLTALLGGVHPEPWPGHPNRVAMPAFGDRLDDEEIAAVATYVRNMAGNAAPAVTVRQVSKARHGLISEALK